MLASHIMWDARDDSFTAASENTTILLMLMRKEYDSIKPLFMSSISLLKFTSQSPAKETIKCFETVI